MRKKGRRGERRGRGGEEKRGEEKGKERDGEINKSHISGALNTFKYISS